MRCWRWGMIASVASTVASRLPWVRTAPLGLPVVPEVKTIRNVVSRVGSGQPSSCASQSSGKATSGPAVRGRRASPEPAAPPSASRPGGPGCPRGPRRADRARRVRCPAPARSCRPGGRCARRSAAPCAGPAARRGRRPGAPPGRGPAPRAPADSRPAADPRLPGRAHGAATRPPAIAAGPSGPTRPGSCPRRRRRRRPQPIRRAPGPGRRGRPATGSRSDRERPRPCGPSIGRGAPSVKGRWRRAAPPARRRRWRPCRRAR